jgi:hypothetical protein
MTDTTTYSSTQDPEAIERDIRRTQDRMSRTVDRIGDQLTPRNLMNALLDKAEDNDIDARKLLDIARRKPIALAMIAGGAIWLASDADAKFPGTGRSSAKGSTEGDAYHQDYIAHMERVERQQNEDDLAYQRRRDLARSNYFMLERGHEEDEGSFRQRLDDAAASFRAKRRAWMDSASDAAGSAGDAAQQAVSRTKSAYSGNPLIGGLLAAAVGAIVGTTVPLTATEDEQLSGLGDAARDKLDDEKDHLIDAAREKKDKLVDKAEQAAKPTDKPRTSNDSGARQERGQPVQG